MQFEDYVINEVAPLIHARCRYVLATGWDDPCMAQNQQLDRILMEKGIAHEFYIWNAQNSHDWPTWQRMAQLYL